LAENRIARYPHLGPDTLHEPAAHGAIARPLIEASAGRHDRVTAAEIGYLHIGVRELHNAERGTLMFVAIDRISKLAFVEFHDAAGEREGSAFLECALEAFPYAIRAVLTDDSLAFADQPKVRDDPGRRRGQHAFERVCIENAIEHVRTKPFHPWTRNQAHRMTRAIEDVTVGLFRYDDIACLKAHVLTFVAGYNSAKPLKALGWRTPHQAICDAWAKDPSVFKVDPHTLVGGASVQALNKC